MNTILVNNNLLSDHHMVVCRNLEIFFAAEVTFEKTVLHMNLNGSGEKQKFSKTTLNASITVQGLRDS